MAREGRVELEAAEELGRTELMSSQPLFTDSVSDSEETGTDVASSATQVVVGEGTKPENAENATSRADPMSGSSAGGSSETEAVCSRCGHAAAGRTKYAVDPDYLDVTRDGKVVTSAPFPERMLTSASWSALFPPGRARAGKPASLDPGRGSRASGTAAGSGEAGRRGRTAAGETRSNDNDDDDDDDDDEIDAQDVMLAESLLAILNSSFVARDGSEAVHEMDAVLQPSHKWVSRAARLKFVSELCQVAERASRVVKRDRILLSVSAPTYILGDLHGNYRDLRLFEDRFWPLGIKLCPASVLFLGDYVDRGAHSLETIGYLLALKILAPNKVFLLRGNHEMASVNSDAELYGASSFLAQCMQMTDKVRVDGERVWRSVNFAFAFMPFAAIVDKEIFCVHGGIPRIVHELAAVSSTNRQAPTVAERLATFPRPIYDNELDEDESALLSDLLWADPATEAQEAVLARQPAFPPGFGFNSRGGRTVVFGSEAVDSFLAKTGCSFLVRAHQPPSLGVSYQKSARVITVFSSSHYCGSYNSAAGVLVADSAIRVIVMASATQPGTARRAAAAPPQPPRRTQPTQPTQAMSAASESSGEKAAAAADPLPFPIERTVCVPNLSALLNAPPGSRAASVAASSPSMLATPPSSNSKRARSESDDDEATASTASPGSATSPTAKRKRYLFK
ncbi:serine/threonine protein phosphatase [Thecamonas trahens ATCC 50062]|uniref:Serine/threonine-protein phosphatase n=1 Tax=Thecamonas trahens ATCC 50062 TaxID=461836 RepID=A0A0L0DGH7_THETB|nr:serine/threonine protein phosphatase [Thecamonas trahens ATCC 50062]KNC50443.1 serine/threonine protein phosphatase [Thecamonas trahens ATCC 50062]|eukprot:XP_013762339.1 serine/threonine protein phosphatase [Thecamonas trahens ATCC 50062]